MQAARRTNTGLLIAGGLILLVGLAWANHRRSTTPTTTTTTDGGSGPAVTAQSTPSSAPSWSGELILVRAASIIGRKSNGSERTIYTAPAGSDLTAATDVAGDHTLVAVSTNPTTVLDLNLRTGTTAARANISSLTLTALRPTTSGLATISFSNAERNFGSTVTLSDAGKSQTLYHADGATITSLAWRADGDALALGTQTSVVIVPLTTGDAKTVELGTPVQTLSWSAGTVVAVTNKNGVTSAAEINPTGATPQTVGTGFGAIGRDLYAYAADRFIWLRAASGLSDIVATTEDSRQYQDNHAQPVTVATASRLLGFLQ